VDDCSFYFSCSINIRAFFGAWPRT
jgi:hypothetical protein